MTTANSRPFLFLNHKKFVLKNEIPLKQVQLKDQLQTRWSDVHQRTRSRLRKALPEFSSATLVNPEIFKRVAVDDCLVNDGRALAPGAALSFKYANTKQYPLKVLSATC
ncbi:hypothetical protein NC653_026496 [Populus alba x Populus x berolinensis]|uniref:Uncharacterized protein n=1 Tax=Populus alba x Populus x berolinensis TaxID=444605 RepID=A0AAD6MF72_9ROSI|nr:hypothetical protein NC653_026496 [Populus alba x Populus x berolinensis]